VPNLTREEYERFARGEWPREEDAPKPTTPVPGRTLVPLATRTPTAAVVERGRVVGLYVYATDELIERALFLPMARAMSVLPDLVDVTDGFEAALALEMTPAPAALVEPQKETPDVEHAPSRGRVSRARRSKRR
jgi:hypothetical protein